jgi:hypothetical protein
MAGDVKAEREGGRKIKTDAKDPPRNESEKEGRSQQASPEDSTAESLAYFI